MKNLHIVHTSVTSELAAATTNSFVEKSIDKPPQCLVRLTRQAEAPASLSRFYLISSRMNATNAEIRFAAVISVVSKPSTSIFTSIDKDR